MNRIVKTTFAIAAATVFGTALVFGGTANASANASESSGLEIETETDIETEPNATHDTDAAENTEREPGDGPADASADKADPAPPPICIDFLDWGWCGVCPDEEQCPPCEEIPEEHRDEFEHCNKPEPKPQPKRVYQERTVAVNTPKFTG